MDVSPYEICALCACLIAIVSLRAPRSRFFDSSFRRHEPR